MTDTATTKQELPSRASSAAREAFEQIRLRIEEIKAIAEKLPHRSEPDGAKRPEVSIACSVILDHGENSEFTAAITGTGGQLERQLSSMLGRLPMPLRFHAFNRCMEGGE